MTDFLTCYINILKAMIGTGLIYFPITFYKCGFIPTLIGIIISAILSIAGFYIYIISNHLSGPTTINSLCKKVNKYFYIYSNLMLILMMLLTAISYTNLIEETYFKIFEYFNKTLIYPKLLLTIHLFLFCFPISFLKSVGELRFSSFIGIVAILYILLLNLIRFLINLGKNKFSLELFNRNNNIFLRLPFLMFSFTAHQTILPLQNEFFNRTPKFFLKVVTFATITSGFIYILLGIIMNYLYDFSSYTFNDSCLIVLPNDIFGLFARISYMILLTFSIPLQLIPLRIILTEIFKKYIEKNFLFEKIIEFGIPIILNTIVFIIYYLEIKQQLIQNISGGLSNTSVCLLFPAFIFIFGIPNFIKKDKYNNKFYYFISLSLLLAAIIVFITFIIAII